jgi:hypothetical protein
MRTVGGVVSKPTTTTELIHLVFRKGTLQEHRVVCNAIVVDDDALPYDMILGTPVLHVLACSIDFMTDTMIIRPRFFQHGDTDTHFTCPITTTDSNARPSPLLVEPSVAAAQVSVTDTTPAVVPFAVSDLAFTTCAVSVCPMDSQDEQDNHLNSGRDQEFEGPGQAQGVVQATESSASVGMDEDVAAGSGDSAGQGQVMAGTGDGGEAAAAHHAPASAPVVGGVHDRWHYASSPDMFAPEQHAFSDRFGLFLGIRDGVAEFMKQSGAPEGVGQVVTDGVTHLAKACVLTIDSLHKISSAMGRVPVGRESQAEWGRAQQMLTLIADRVQVAVANGVSGGLAGDSSASVRVAVLDDSFMGVRDDYNLVLARHYATGAAHRSFDLAWGGVCDACGFVAHQRFHSCTPPVLPAGHMPQYHCLDSAACAAANHYAYMISSERAVRTATVQQRQLACVATAIDPAVMRQLHDKPDVLRSVLAKQEHAASLVAQAQQEAALALSTMQTDTAPMQQQHWQQQQAADMPFQ